MVKKKLKGVRKIFCSMDAGKTGLPCTPFPLKVTQSWSTRSCCSTSSNETEPKKSYQDLKMYVNQRRKNAQERQQRHERAETETAVLAEIKQSSFQRVMDPSDLPNAPEESPPKTKPEQPIKPKTPMEPPKSPKSLHSFDKSIKTNEPSSPTRPSSKKFFSKGLPAPTTLSFDLEKDEEGTEVVLTNSVGLPSPPPQRRFAGLSLRKCKKHKEKSYGLTTLVIPTSDREGDRYAPDGEEQEDEEDDIEIIRRGYVNPSPDFGMDRYAALSEEFDEKLLVRTNSKFRGDDSFFFANVESIGPDWSDDEQDFEIESIEKHDSVHVFHAKHVNSYTGDDWDYPRRGRQSVTTNDFGTDEVIALAREDAFAPAGSCMP